MKNKIAYVIPTLSMGGAEKQQINILNGIDTNKYDVKLYVLRSNIKLLTQMKNDDIEVIVCNINSIFDFKEIVYFVKNINKFNPDIIHSQMYNANIIVRLLKFFLPRVKIINHYHGMSAWISKVKLFIDNISLDKVSSFIVVSEKSYELRISREKYPKDKLEILYNSVNLDIDVVQDKFTINKPLVIGMASRLIPLKNIEAGIYMLAKLLEKGLDITLIIAGDGEEKENLYNYAKELKVEERVTFLGFIDNMSSFYKEIDIYCLSSKTEDMPLSIIEAMMFGKPIISSNVGGIPDMSRDINYTVLIKDFYNEESIDNIYNMLYSCNDVICSRYLNNIAMIKYDNDIYCNKLDSIYTKILKEQV